MARTAEEQLGVSLEDDSGLAEAAEPLAAEPAEQAPPEAPSRPDWLPENFQNEEAFVKSYNEMGGKLREEADRRKEMERRLGELEAAREQPDEPQGPEWQQWRDQVEALFEQDPIQAISYMAQQAAQQESTKQLREFQAQQFATQQTSQTAQFELIAAQADQVLGSKYGDWNDVKGDVAAAFESDPNLMSAAEAMSLQGAATAYDRAYKVVKYRQMEQAVAQGLPIHGYDPTTGQAPPQQAQPAPMLPQSELNRIAKLQGQTLTGGNGRMEATDPQDDWLARMRKAHEGQSWSQLRT